MRPMTLPVLLALPLFAPYAIAVEDEVSGFDHAHAAFDAVLGKQVHGDRVDYAALKRERGGLDDYTTALETVDVGQFGGWSSDQRFAFWINAYNAYTLQTVIDHYPVKSIRDIKKGLTGVWDIDFIELGSLAPRLDKTHLSLNDIEHQILRKDFSDARVHAAVNCASEGCPPLASSAFIAAKLDDQLTRQVRAWVADGVRNRFDQERNCLELSKIFDWFGKDFERDAGSVQAWVRRYAPEDTHEWFASAGKLKVNYLDYSWKLNEVSE